MTRLPEGILGKTLALVLVAALGAGLYVIVVAPAIGVYAARKEALQDRLDQVSRLHASAADLGALRAADAAWKARYRDGNVLLGGTNDALAAAGLESLMKDAAAEGNAVLSSASTLPVEVQGNFRRIGLHLTLSGTQAQVASLFHGVETAEPLLLVDNLEVAGGANRAGDDGAADPTVNVSFDVFGFRAP